MEGSAKTSLRARGGLKSTSRSAGASSGSASSKTGDAVVFALAIALGVAMIVVIILICVYASKRNGSSDGNGSDEEDDCEDGKDTRYIEIDVLAQETPTTVLAESGKPRGSAATAPVPVVLPGPLHGTGGKGRGPTLVQASGMPNLVASPEHTYLFVYSDYCGACKKLKRELADLEHAGEDVSAAHFLSTDEVNKLPADLKSQLEPQYIPTLFKVGKGTVTKEQVGAPPADKIRSYFLTKHSK